MKKMPAERLVLIGIVAVLLCFGAWYFVHAREALRQTAWHAVFLTNGQVYFGKIAKENDTQVVLTHIYYLQVRDQQLQGSTSASSTRPDLSLVKLGNELHGPTDEMRITRTQVLFTETLKSDSKVTQAIQSFESPSGK
jgi:hypothetical protein